MDWTRGVLRLCVVVLLRGRIAPRGAARAQGPRSAARRVPLSGWAARSRQPRAAASAESEGPIWPIIRRERAAGFGGRVLMTALLLCCNTAGLSSRGGGWGGRKRVSFPNGFHRPLEDDLLAT